MTQLGEQSRAASMIAPEIAVEAQLLRELLCRSRGPSLRAAVFLLATLLIARLGADGRNRSGRPELCAQTLESVRLRRRRRQKFRHC